MPTAGNLLCQCGRFMRVHKNGVTVEELTDPPDPQPYRLWQADHYRCPGCGAEAITGFGFNPLAHHYDTERYEKLKSYAKEHGWFHQGM